MWITPKLSAPTKGWKIEKSTNFILLEKQKSLLSREYRIVIKRSEASIMIVATADTESQILEHWKYVEALLPGISNEPDDKNEVFQYLELKFESLARTEEDEAHLTFRQTFGLAKETVIDYYACALSKTLPRQGWMYLTNNFIAFTSKMIKDNIIIPLKEVTSIRKDGVINKTITITTKSVECVFGAFLRRDTVYEVAEQLWKVALEQLLVSAELTMGKIDTQQKYQKPTGPGSPFRKSVSLNDTSFVNNLNGSVIASTSRNVNRRNSVIEINTEKKNEDFRALFRFPTEEKVIAEYVVQLSVRKDNVKSRGPAPSLRGTFYVSQHFLSFCAKAELETVLVIPFLEVKTIKREGECMVVILNHALQFHFAFLYREMEKAFEVSTKLCSTVQTLVTAKETENLIKFLSAKPDTPFCDEDSLEQKQNWDRYMTRYKHVGFCVLKETQELAILLRTMGIPDHLRPLMWPICSGSLYKWLAQPGLYLELLERYNNDESSISMSDIDKDLHRSFPSHPFYQKKENLAVLRRLLVTYSWRNTSIGYTQSMNVVAAMLLIVMGEEAAFWQLATICEDLLPDHYGKMLVGPIVDQQILESLIKKELPEIWEHIEYISFSIGVLTYGWFMCLYVGYLPLEATLRIMDVFCFEGKKALFQVALAIFKVNEDIILDEEDGMGLVQKIKDSMLNPTLYKEVLRIAFEDLNHVIIEETSYLSLRFQAIKTLEDNNKVNEIYNLKNITHYTNAQLDDIHEKFHALIDVHSNTASINRDGFKKLLIAYMPLGFVQYLRNNEDVWEFLWRRTRNADDDIEFSTFVFNLSAICKESLEDRVNFMLELYDQDDDMKVTKPEFVRVVESIISLYNSNDNVPFIQSFADMIFDQIEGSNELSSDSTPEIPKISFPILKREMITNCKLTGMFTLEKPIVKNQSSPAFGRIARNRSATVC